MMFSFIGERLVLMCRRNVALALAMLLLVATGTVRSAGSPWSATANAVGQTGSPSSEATGLTRLIPPLPASFYGAVTVDGADVPAGTHVSAWIDGVRYATTEAFVYEGRSTYAVDVPADDPATPVVEGGRPGDTTAFQVGGLKAEQTAAWRGGTNTELDLTASSVELFLPLISRGGTQGD